MSLLGYWQWVDMLDPPALRLPAGPGPLRPMAADELDAFVGCRASLERDGGRTAPRAVRIFFGCHARGHWDDALHQAFLGHSRGRPEREGPDRNARREQDICYLGCVSFLPDGSPVLETLRAAAHLWAAQALRGGRREAPDMEAWQAYRRSLLGLTDRLAKEGAGPAAIVEALRLRATDVSLVPLATEEGVFRAEEHVHDPDETAPADEEDGDASRPTGCLFVKDLALAAGEAAAGPLAAYLGTLPAGPRIDTRVDRRPVYGLLDPRIPAASWPHPGDHPARLSQRLALGAALGAGGPHPLLSVNGPPGTGKSTLIRDLAAETIHRRAARLAAFDRPESAFFRWGQAWRPDAGIVGFEIMVASSNNEAVFNISKTLPLAASVSGSLAYFSAAAARYAAILGDPSEASDVAAWGTVAAPLGAMKQRRAFDASVWVRMAGRPAEGGAGVRDAKRMDLSRPYLSTILYGRSAPEVAAAAEAAEARDGRPPAWLQLPDWAAARRRFRHAVEAFEAATSRAAALHADTAKRLAVTATAADLETAIALSERHLRELERIERHHAWLDHLETVLACRRRQLEWKAARDAFLTLKSQGARTSDVMAADTRVREARQALDQAERDVADIDAGDRRLDDPIDGIDPGAPAAEADLERLRQMVAAHEAGVARRAAESAPPGTAIARTPAELARLRDALALARGVPENTALARRTPGGIGVEAWLSGPPDELATPWSGPGPGGAPDPVQAARQELFAASLALHEAFIRAAALPVRENLSTLFGFLRSGQWPPGIGGTEIEALWRTFFLVFPVATTTLASVQSLFQGLGPGTLGLVIVDEAGQATPHSVVGALRRARQAVLVGDPLQLEPVVTLPPAIGDWLDRAFDIEPGMSVGHASAQSVADAVSPYGTEIAGADGEAVRVGLPLRVQYRCHPHIAEIANRITYGGLIISGVPADRPPPFTIADSRWIDVPWEGDDTQGHFDGALGRTASLLLRYLFEASPDGAPDVAVISPFRDVRDGLRRDLWPQDWAQGVGGDAKARRFWINARVNTIHSFQGKEHDIVLIALGGGSAGAIRWAAQKPNLLNVAVTRARHRVFVIGDTTAWCGGAPHLRHFRCLRDALGTVGVDRFEEGMRRRSARARPGVTSASSAGTAGSNR
ncbi:MAG TPA: ATP-binding protein [Azospirillaceae bacterium]|nr:ATP-binding protein [Azospirillaceae bacterium]